LSNITPATTVGVVDHTPNIGSEILSSMPAKQARLMTMTTMMAMMQMEAITIRMMKIMGLKRDTDEADSECGDVNIGGTSPADDYGCPPDNDGE
jgi:hypothetical protein